MHNLLDLSRVKAGGVQIKLQRVDASEAVRACEKIQRVEAAEHSHELHVEIAPDLSAVRADDSALRRAVCTIVENAIKYTPDGGSITLRAYDADEQVLIEVEDTGRGIHSEDLRHIFESFYRGRASSDAVSPPSADAQEVPGIGLGLHLARVLVEGMNGSIEVRSQVGIGSTFILRLPVWRDEVDGDDEEMALSSFDAVVGKSISGAVK